MKLQPTTEDKMVVDAAGAGAGAGAKEAAGAGAGADDDTEFTPMSGQYDLISAVTHKGRDADGGHYVGWVNNKNKEEEWILFDDDTLSTCDIEDIKKLAGGGDWHTAYLLLYKARPTDDYLVEGEEDKKVKLKE